MRKILCLSVLACLLCLAAYNPCPAASKGKSGRRSASAAKTAPKAEKAAPAADAAKQADQPASKPADEKKSDEKKSDDAKAGDAGKTDEGAGSAFGFGGLGGGNDELPFDLIQAASIQFNPDGMTVLTNKVHIESKDFNISCDQLKLDNKTKMVYGTGNPVKLDQGPAVQAFCRNLIYNMESRSATLENDASIIQDKGGQKTKVTADKIIIDNSENKDGKGQPKVTLTMREGSNSIPKIEVLGKKSSGATGKKTNKSQKVSGNNMDLIKVPTMAKTPGVD